MRTGKPEADASEHFAMQDGCIEWTPVLKQKAGTTTGQASLDRKTVSTPADLSTDDAPEDFIKYSTQ